VELHLQPIFLLADSQLMFWRGQGNWTFDTVRALVSHGAPKAAYIGASNGDVPDFYSIFEAAMDSIEVRDQRMIRSSFPSQDESFLRQADIIVLAGGNVATGWDVFVRTHMKEIIEKRYLDGSILIGISAGAMQLGLYGLIEETEMSTKLVDTFKLVPFVISTHAEKSDWKQLINVIQLLDNPARGLGISAGGGLIYYPDHTLEAIRYPVCEFSIAEGEIKRSLLLPVSNH
jgi:cyanophycinase